MNPIQIVIADDHEIVRTGFRTILQQQYAGEIEFIGDASNGNNLIELVTKCQPQVVITDIQMPFMDGIQACKFIKRQFPDIAVIAFSMFSDINNIIGMIQAGATGYLVKTCDKEEILEAIHTVAQKESYYCSNISEKMYGEIVNSTQRKKKAIVWGAQEKKIMELICKQYSTKEIATQMQLAIKTVEHYRENIQEKIGARNMVGVALYAVIYGIVKYSDLLV